MKLTMTFTLTVEDDTTIPTFGTAIDGLPDEDDDEDGRIEKLADKLSDAFAATVKGHNEQTFREEVARRQS